MSVSGIINTHFIVAHMIARLGTAGQKDYFVPRMAVGEVRGAFSMSEPGLGSELPLRDSQRETGHADDLSCIGGDPAAEDLAQVTADWDLDAYRPGYPAGIPAARPRER